MTFTGAGVGAGAGPCVTTVVVVGGAQVVLQLPPAMADLASSLRLIFCISITFSESVIKSPPINTAFRQTKAA
jgi:hypothetical protein